MHISLLVAMDRNGVIGQGDGLPWRLPADLRRVKALTMGKPIIMGRRTFDTIKKPLPGRRNIVMTRQDDWSFEGVEVAHDADAALALAGDVEEVMILGGSFVYAAFLPRADRLYLTLVETEAAGDTWFPDWDRSVWEVIEREDFAPDEKHALPYSFQTLVRRRP